MVVCNVIHSKAIGFLQVTEARETLLKKLQNKTDQGTFEDPKPSDAKDAEDRKTVDQSESSHRSEAAEPQNEEDVSFSDLEEDDDTSTHRTSTSDKAWVQLDEDTKSQGAKPKADHNSSKDKESEGEDWLTVDDTDFDNLGAM